MKIASLLALLGLLQLDALAVEFDRRQPIDIQADTSETDLARGITHLKGNVRIEQGDLKINAAQGDIYNDGRVVSKVILRGRPASWELRSADEGTVTASAEIIEYRLAEEIIELTGNAFVSHPQGEARGDHIRYDLRNEQFQGRGSEPGNGIRIRLNPPEPKAAAGDDTEQPDSG